MPHRTAFLVSTAVTVAIVLVGLGLIIQVSQHDPDERTTEPAAAAEAARDQQYLEAFDTLITSNAALATSYDRIATLLDEVAELRAQNAALRGRDAQFQERLAEANRRLVANGGPAIGPPALIAAPSPEGATSPSAADAAGPAPAHTDPRQAPRPLTAGQPPRVQVSTGQEHAPTGMTAILAPSPNQPASAPRRAATQVASRESRSGDRDTQPSRDGGERERGRSDDRSASRELGRERSRD